MLESNWSEVVNPKKEEKKEYKKTNEKNHGDE